MELIADFLQDFVYLGLGKQKILMLYLSDVFVKINVELFGASNDEINECPNVAIFIVKFKLFDVLLMLGSFYVNLMANFILSRHRRQL